MQTRYRDKFYIFLQYILPHHRLSRWCGKLGNSRLHWLKNMMIRYWIRKYRISLEDACYQYLEDYQTFNDFFTRKLKQDARSFAPEVHAIASPAEGVISQMGEIKDGHIFQAKGRTFSVDTLLGTSNHAFTQGSFTTIYLSPRDYHRVHMPVTGTLKRMTYIPGQLFSVSTLVTENIPGVFARNERVIALFDTRYGPIAVVMVGAMIVGSIETVWHGQVAPIKQTIHQWRYGNTTPVSLNKGDEIGHFRMGSTVILLLSQDHVVWKNNISTGAEVQLGRALASIQ